MAQCHLVGQKMFNLGGPDSFSYYWHDLHKEEEVFSTRPQVFLIRTLFGWAGKARYVL